MSDKDPNVLIPLIKEIKSLIQYGGSMPIEMIPAELAWRLTKVLEVINAVSLSLRQSHAIADKPLLNELEVLVLTKRPVTQEIFESPYLKEAAENIGKRLHMQIREALNNVEIIKGLSSDCHFMHFAFGPLNKSQTIQFLEAHTNFHLKRIKDALVA
jgi:hypothetical protein